MVFSFAVGFVLLFVQPFPVLHDYPEWMYQGHIAYSLFTGVNKSLNQMFEWIALPVPNALSQVAIGGLNLFVSPVEAGRLWLGVYLLLVVLTSYRVSRMHSHNGAAFWLFTITIAFGTGFWNGYINYQFGLILFAWFVAGGVRNHPGRVLFFSLCIYFSHASVFAGFVCYVVMSELCGRRNKHTFFALVPGLALLFWYSASQMVQGATRNESLGSLMQWVQYKAYTLAKLGPFHNFIGPDGESLLARLHGLYVTGFVVNFMVAGCIGIWLLFIVWQLIRGKLVGVAGRAHHIGLLLTVVILLLAWLAAGKNSFGVVNLGERFLIIAVMLLIVNVHCPVWLRNSWVLLSVVISIGTLMALVTLSRYADTSYSVDRSADSKELESYVEDIYQNSRHKYFNHRLFIYSHIGQYLTDPAVSNQPPLIDHESSIIQIRQH